MRHRSPCPHLADSNWTRYQQGFGNLTRNKKDCSTDQQELERWTGENATFPQCPVRTGGDTAHRGACPGIVEGRIFMRSARVLW